MSVCRTWLAGALIAGSVGVAQAAPDALHGSQVYTRCLACHALAYDRVGPRHCGLLGRPAGSVPGFSYSQAMKNSHITWDEKTLNLFLAQPLKTVPGSSMTYDGVADPKDRADLIAYLRQADTTPECRAQMPAKR
ncbi:c-type cytochrome [Hydrogenophaga sp.]|uniref:c-type cytochrome n=1 Tax=Hydrogenophaga sp. TaxID=1904254 RepID=UPI003F6F55CB